MRVKKSLISLIAFIVMAVALCFGLTACGAKKEYTLTFVTNGAEEIAPITAVAGAEITPPANPEKDGFVCEGWYEKADFSGSSVTIPKKMPKRSVTYYANFTPRPKAVLTVDFCGVKENEQYSLSTGTKVSEFLKEIDTASDKATFVGWYIEDSPLSDQYLLNANGVTVKAAWNVNYTLNVYKQTDDGYVFDKTYELSGRLDEIPVIDENYGGEGYKLSQSTLLPKLTLGENTVDAYYDFATFTITYVIDDSDHENGYVRQTYRYNQTATVEDCTVQRDGYRFIGWATEYGKAPNNTYKPSQKFTVTSDLSLYVCWNRSYAQVDGTDVVWLNPFVTDSGAATLEKDGQVYEGEVNGVELTFEVDGTTVYARITDKENFVFSYRDKDYGFYAYYDYVDGNTYNTEILYLDGYGLATYNTFDLSGGLTAEYYGNYSFTDYNDFKFTIINIETGRPQTDQNGNELYFYFILDVYSNPDEYIKGTFTIQGLESNEFIVYSNGEFGYDILLLNGYGSASIYIYDVAEDDVALYARGSYMGTENYEGEYGEWQFVSDDGKESFKFILSYVDGVSVYIIFEEQFYGEYMSSENNSTLYLDGYGSALYVLADKTALQGIAIVENDFVTFYAYNQVGQQVGKIYFNLNRNNMTFTQNDTGFIINGTVLSKYVGTSAIIEIPDTITEIGESAFHYIDLECTVISVTIPESVIKIGARAFENDHTLRRVYVKSAIPCELGDKAFDWVGGDFIIIVPDESTELYRNAPGWSNYSQYIFGEKEILEKPEFEIVDGVLIRYNRKDVTGSVNLVIPDEVTEIAAGVFYGINYLVSVDLNNVTKIGADAFALCENLESITCLHLVEIGASAFLGCSALTQINLPAVKIIGETAFSACYALTRVIVGENIQFIGDMAFRECAFTYTIAPDGSETVIPELLFVQLTGNKVPDMGGMVFYGTQGRVQVKNIDVALSCFNNPTWAKYVGTLYIPSGEEKGVYYDVESLQTLVLDGRAIVYSMEVWLYAINGKQITFYIYDSDELTLSHIGGTIQNGEITIIGSGVSYRFVKEGKQCAYTDNEGNSLVVALGGGSENTVNYTLVAEYNGKQVDLFVQPNKIYFNFEGYKYELTLYPDSTFYAKKSIIPYTVHVTAEDGSELDITFGNTLGVTGTFKDINGEQRTAQTVGTWYITEQSTGVYTVTVYWRSDKYLVTVTVNGETFTYEWKLNVSATSYHDESTGNGVIIYTNSQGEIVDIHLMINGVDGVKADVSQDYVLKEDGTYVFVVDETIEYYDEESKQVITEPSPYNGTYTVTLDMQNRTCEIIYKDSIEKEN